MAPPIPPSPGDEDPDAGDDRVGARFLVQKISTDLTGDPNVLLAGETLRYTITVKNIGNGRCRERRRCATQCRRTRPTSRAARP